ncbi:MAG: iron-containing alcohol dehydrogenase [Chloroflexi bacterium]|nr:iron-containing alcohol dehydrogenase [Chloroflexota bacterium]
MSTVWPLPKVTYTPLNMTTETRPVALLTSETAWTNFGNVLNLPLVVQAEPASEDRDLLDYLADHLPSQTEVIYVLGNGIPLTAGKIVANKNKLPLVIIPTAISSDEIFEPHVTLPAEGLMHRLEVGPATEVIIDWSVIEAAAPYERASGIVDLLAIVTALLDWRYAAKTNRNTPEQQFSQWGAGVAAGLATQAIKSAKDIGEGKIEALRTLVDLLMMSVQLANQLGHDRHEEGTEHYLAFSMGNQGAKFNHAEAVGPGILFTSALHGQDPSALREALQTSGVRLDQLRAGDVRLAINDLPNFCTTNNLPYGIGHEIDPFSDQVTKALEKAGLVEPVATTWQAAPTIIEPSIPTADTNPLTPPAMG